MSADVKYIIFKDSIVVSYDNKVYNIHKSSFMFNKILKLIKENKLDEILDVLDIKKGISKKSNKFFEIIDGEVYSYGEKVPSFIANKVIELYENDLPFAPLINFWNKLKNNPSERSRKSLYNFLSVNKFTITEDGDFIAYKKVCYGDDGKLYDCWTKTIRNDINKYVEIDRKKVDPDPNVPCSTGLHVAAFDYAANVYNGDVLLEVKVNPVDVVAVPYDYNHQKIRVCKYFILRTCGNMTQDIIYGLKIDRDVVNIEDNNLVLTIKDEKFNYNTYDSIRHLLDEKNIILSECDDSITEELKFIYRNTYRNIYCAGKNYIIELRDGSVIYLEAHKDENEDNNIDEVIINNLKFKIFKYSKNAYNDFIIDDDDDFIKHSKIPKKIKELFGDKIVKVIGNYGTHPTRKTRYIVLTNDALYELVWVNDLSFWGYKEDDEFDNTLLDEEIIKIGNYKYKVDIYSNPLDVEYCKKIKPSKRPKSIMKHVRDKGYDIKSLRRCENDNRYMYYVDTFNGVYLRYIRV